MNDPELVKIYGDKEPTYKHHEYDDDCPDCQPAMMDLKTGKPLPDDHPHIIVMRRAFKERTTLTERRAWGRVVLGQSQNPQDIEIMKRVSKVMQQALEGLPDETPKNQQQ